MAQHKAPTAVTFAPTTEASGFALWVERYWKIAALVAVAITGVILYRAYARSTHRQTQDSSWAKLMAVAKSDNTNGSLVGPPAELQELEGQLRGQHAAPWALYIAATSALGERKYDEAKQALTKLRAGYPDHPLVKDAYALDDGGALSVVDRLEQRVDALQTWSAAHPDLFDNPKLPETASRVRLKTDRGDVVIGFYADLAPNHVERFLRLAREGTYTGTKFHRVIAGSWIEGGDPNSIAGEPSTWGQGGYETTLELEPSTLKNFPGAVGTTTRPGLDKSTGTSFLIVTGEAHQLDGQNTVFGRVLEGMNVVREIERGTLSADGTRPEDPVTIQSVEVL